MKRFLFPAAVALCLFLAVIYQFKDDFIKIPEHNLTPIPKQVSDQGPNQSPQQDADDSLKKKEVDSAYFTLAKAGKAEGIEFAIGDKKDEILNQWGKPDETGVFEGYSYISYDNKTFFYDESDTIKQIAFNGDFKTYGIASGMKPEELQKILGSPSYEGALEQDQVWGAEYFLGEYSVIFISESKDAPIISMILQKNE